MAKLTQKIEGNATAPTTINLGNVTGHCLVFVESMSGSGAGSPQDMVRPLLTTGASATLELQTGGGSCDVRYKVLEFSEGLTTAWHDVALSTQTSTVNVSLSNSFPLLSWTTTRGSWGQDCIAGAKVFNDAGQWKLTVAARGTMFATLNTRTLLAQISGANVYRVEDYPYLGGSSVLPATVNTAKSFVIATYKGEEYNNTPQFRITHGGARITHELARQNYTFNNEAQMYVIEMTDNTSVQHIGPISLAQGVASATVAIPSPVDETRSVAITNGVYRGTLSPNNTSYATEWIRTSDVSVQIINGGADVYVYRNNTSAPITGYVQVLQFEKGGTAHTGAATADCQVGASATATVLRIGGGTLDSALSASASALYQARGAASADSSLSASATGRRVALADALASLQAGTSGAGVRSVFGAASSGIETAATSGSTTLLRAEAGAGIALSATASSFAAQLGEAGVQIGASATGAGVLTVGAGASAGVGFDAASGATIRAVGAGGATLTFSTTAHSPQVLYGNSTAGLAFSVGAEGLRSVVGDSLAGIALDASCEAFPGNMNYASSVAQLPLSTTAAQGLRLRVGHALARVQLFAYSDMSYDYQRAMRERWKSHDARESFSIHGGDTPEEL